MHIVPTLATATPDTTPATVTQPSPQLVRQQIQDCLKQSNYREMWDIDFEFQGGTAILQGRVCSFYAKQTAQELIRNIDGVDEIRNQLEVL